ncbi:phosphodiesterase [Haematococcus lacustris]|uniref:Phosphodiesterase n=1 Tax=Haematococcus lacustris TaxID=44745 RepID=A0A699Z2Q5_HAELA|nr:phosphodiesterase [Haematococcus lacustris]
MAEDGWLFDAFQLAEVSQGRPLSTLAFALLRRMHLIAHFQLSEARLARFLCAIEDGYPSNPYHCRTHAADVLRTVHCMMTRGKVGKMLGGDQRVDLLAVYLSALIHDFEHKGVNNQYLITTGDELALRYNDHSPMENHHIAAAFQLMLHDETNFFTNTNSKVREVIRRYVIELVLATDMKQAGSLPTPPPLANMGNKGQGVMDDDLRLLTLQMVMKVSDLGHLAHAKDVHRRWVQLLEEELFRQGDLEVAAGLPVSPLMDRTKAGVTRSQAGFFSLVCLPQLQAFTTVFSGCQPMLDQARENNQMWLEEARLQGEASPAPGLSGSPSRRYGPVVLPPMLSKADDGEEAATAPVTPAVVERAEGEEAGAAEGQRK